MTDLVAPIGDDNVSSSIEPLSINEVTPTVTPPFVTENIVGEGTDPATSYKSSLKVTVIFRPVLSTVAVENTGPNWSTAELFGSIVFAVYEMATFPATSWTASLFVAGVVYATVTVLPAPTGALRVSTNVEPLTTTLLIVIVSVPFFTTNELAVGMTSPNASLYVIVSSSPVVSTDAEL